MTNLIPTPLGRRGRHALYPWATMKLGEFFFVPNRETNTMGSLAWSTGKKLGRTFSTRLCWMTKATGPLMWKLSDEDKKTATLGIGVWRVK